MYSIDTIGTVSVDLLSSRRVRFREQAKRYQSDFTDGSYSVSANGADPIMFQLSGLIDGASDIQPNPALVALHTLRGYISTTQTVTFKQLKSGVLPSAIYLVARLDIDMTEPEEGVAHSVGWTLELVHESAIQDPEDEETGG